MPTVQAKRSSSLKIHRNGYTLEVNVSTDLDLLTDVLDVLGGR